MQQGCFRRRSQALAGGGVISLMTCLAGKAEAGKKSPLKSRAASGPWLFPLRKMSVIYQMSGGGGGGESFSSSKWYFRSANQSYVTAPDQLRNLSATLQNRFFIVNFSSGRRCEIWYWLRGAFSANDAGEKRCADEMFIGNLRLPGKQFYYVNELHVVCETRKTGIKITFNIFNKNCKQTRMVPR